MNNSWACTTMWIVFLDNDDVVMMINISSSRSHTSFVDVSPNQMHQVTLDPVEKTRLTWMVDWPEKNVFFQVKNGINEKFSWFAIGFSRRGEFPRTDFCIFQRENGRIDINIVSHKSGCANNVDRIPFHHSKTIRFNIRVMSKRQMFNLSWWKYIRVPFTVRWQCRNEFHREISCEIALMETLKNSCTPSTLRTLGRVTMDEK